MTRLVQTFPEGLTALLQLKGQEALSFPPELRGVVDMLPFYLTPKWEIEGVAGPATSTTSFLELEVAEDEYWVVLQVSYEILCGNNNDVVQGSLSYDPRGAGSTVTVAASPAAQAQPGSTGRFFRTGEKSSAFWEPSQMFIAKPGDKFNGSPSLLVPGGASAIQHVLGAVVAKFTN